MFTLRCTPKLIVRLRATPVREPVGATTTLGDWYANLLYLQREQVVLFVNERSLLPVLVPARDARSLTDRFREAVRVVFLQLGVAPATVQAELREMQEARVGKTASRQILGSMTDFAIMLRAGRRSGSLRDTSLELAETPCSPLGMRSPDAVALELLSAPREINPGPKGS